MATSGLRNLLKQKSKLQVTTLLGSRRAYFSRKSLSNACGGLQKFDIFLPIPPSQILVRRYSVKGTIWDDSDWMKHGDSNAEAYEELDITKLRPFPEFRNVATGPVWGPNAFQRVWDTYYDTQAPKNIVAQQNEEWRQFVEDNGFDPVEYFASEDFKDRYGDKLIWATFRRNHKGAIPPRRTRQYCLSFGKTGNPCPLCRDDKILINFKNLPLLLNFIEPLSGETYSTSRTSVCRKKQGYLEKAIWLARDQGLLSRPVNAIPNHDPSSYQCHHLAVSPK